jgi:hypothetical protein
MSHAATTPTRPVGDGMPQVALHVMATKLSINLSHVIFSSL